VKPAVVFPFYDPKGIMFPHLQAITPQLKQLFETAYLGVPQITEQLWPDHVRWLKADPFFHLFSVPTEAPVGERFLSLYQQTAAACPPEQLLHLCFIDRLAFALHTDFQAQFTADVQALTPADTPFIFQRSAAAWTTHPRYYATIEGFATQVGEFLFGRRVDYCWCHLVMRAGQLAAICPQVHNPDLSMVAELILPIREIVHTRDVDWLAWEDPYILARDGDALRAESEADPKNALGRLKYVLPIIDLLRAAAVSRDQEIK
jgi:hypothetical protein